MKSLIVLTKPGCIFCRVLKEELEKLNVPFTEISDPKSITVPIIYDNDKKTIYQGLPNKQKLLQIIRDFYSNNGGAN